MATRGWWRTCASRILAGMRASFFQIEYEFDGMVGLGIYDVEVINQVLDKEEAPATRRLQLGEFGLQVGRLRLDGSRTFPLIGDAHGERGVRGLHLNNNGN